MSDAVFDIAIICGASDAGFARDAARCSKVQRHAGLARHIRERRAGEPACPAE